MEKGIAMKLIPVICLLAFISIVGIILHAEHTATRYDEWNNTFDYKGGLIKTAPCNQNRLTGYFNPYSCPSNEQYYLTHNIPLVSGFGNK